MLAKFGAPSRTPRGLGFQLRSCKGSVISHRDYSKKIGTSTTEGTPAQQPTQPHSPSPKNNIPDMATNPRDFWKGKFFDLSPRQQQALVELVSAQNKLFEPYATNEELQVPILQLKAAAEHAVADVNAPIRVCVSGAAGAIGYALLFRIASGSLFGPHTPVILHLLEIPASVPKVKGVEMELRDAAFPVLRDIVITDSPEKAFEGIDYALLVGAQPRTAGMERGDLLLKNAEIFSTQGKALNKVAKGKDTRVIVVGNPANTNALIAQRNAPKIPPQNFSAMTRLDHNRGIAQLSQKTKTSVMDIEKFVIWGNHSATQVPDISYATIKGEPARIVINDDPWVEKTFIPCVQKRGAEILAARGASSTASAASALVDATIDWHFGTYGKWTSAAVFSNGEYGVEKGLFFSYPVTFSQKKYNIIGDLPISDEVRKKIEITHKELIQERDAVSKLLPN